MRHLIMLSSAYSIGKRIALDYPICEISKSKNIQKDYEKILEKCGHDVPLGQNYIEAKGPNWQDVIDSDPYFEDILLIETLDEFINLIKKDRYLTGLDVAKYIITKVPCTHLKLEKLTYLCYADYLCENNEKLFCDTILTYKLGPVINSVYKEYKKSGKKLIEDDEKIFDESKLKMPMQSRIVASKNGIKKLFSINKTLENYSNLTGSELVDITHKKNTPWSMSNETIEDETIKKYHINENV